MVPSFFYPSNLVWSSFVFKKISMLFSKQKIAYDCTRQRLKGFQQRLLEAFVCWFFFSGDIWFLEILSNRRVEFLSI